MKTSHLILGIETSCDETGVALVRISDHGCATVLAEGLASQIELHAQYGGVVPELASREHLQALPLLCEEVLSKAAVTRAEISAIGVTVGPGLKGCLLIGLVFAQALSSALSIPLVPVNHIEGHLFAHELEGYTVAYPFLALIVSGGHTELVQVSDFGSYTVLSRTRDDAAGEAFDKSAALMGFPYPGGVALATLADSVESSRFSLPKVSREMVDFSFSGLKTAVALAIAKNRELLQSDINARAEMAWAVQDAIVETCIAKTQRAREHTGTSRLVIAGGVAANRTLRSRLQQLFGSDLVVAPIKYCTDNGSMIALVAAKRFLLKQHSLPSAEIRCRWPLENLAEVA